MNQPLITNFLAANDPRRTAGHTFGQNPQANHVRHNTQVMSDGHGHYWAILPGYPQFQIGTLALYEDNNDDQWINHIVVLPQFQRMGVARRLVQRAIQEHGHIYASNSPHDPGGDDDTRHLSQEGAALVTGLIVGGIMHANWLRPPVI
jgi:GNAT superfamily N-acetyltransferase